MSAACFVDIDEGLLNNRANPDEGGSQAGDSSFEGSNNGDGSNVIPPDGGASDAEAGPGACPSGPLVLCDDFERAATNVVGSWSMMETAIGGTVTIEGTAPGTRFLHAHLNAQSVQGGKAALHKNYGLSATAVRVTARVRHDIDTSTSNSEIIGVGFSQGAGKCQSIYLAYRNNGVKLAQENPCESGSAPEVGLNLTKDVFHTIELSVVVDGMAEVLVDGTSVATTTTGSFVKAGFPAVYAGISYAGPNAAINVDVDDLVFVATPAQ